MMELVERKFTRMSGTGNSFIICHDLSGNLKPIEQGLRSRLAKKLCQDTSGLAADGFIILEPSQKLDFKWDFYNGDGSQAEMCGNAARCAAIFYHLKIQQQKFIQFETLAGDISSEIINSDNRIVQVTMPKIIEVKKNHCINLNKKAIEGSFLNTGVPHFVLYQEPNFELAVNLRNAKEFGKFGANITFIDSIEEDYLNAVTFERGVENFTLSCGTGAVAAAFVHQLNFASKSEFLVEMPGGVLSVNLQNESPLLTGEVEMQFDFLIYKDDL